MPSNIREVIGNLRHVQQRLPANLASMMQSLKFAPRLRYIAGSVMDDGTILTPEEKMFIPDLLDTFMHATANGEMKFSIQMIPIEKLIEFVDDKNDFLRMEVEEELVRWVAEYKEKKGRDYYADGTPRSDEVIARRVAFAIQADAEPWLRSKNPTGLRRFIGLTELPADKVSALLRAVLKAWVVYMRETLPELARAEIRKSFT